MIKAVRMDSKIRVVWYADPAIADDVDRQAYVQALHERPSEAMSLLRFKDGEKPTVFEVGVIPPAELLAIEAEHFKTNLTLLNWHCFLHAVRAIENAAELEVDLTDKAGRMSRSLPTIKVNGLDYVDPTHLAKVMVGQLRLCAVAIGSVAYSFNTLTERDTKNF
jgi:hypothetical protein